MKKILKYEDNISKYGCRDSSAIRLVDEESDFRSDFFRDIDRIIYSLSYARYIDKTQVFSNINNDHVSKRITHVQFVSKLARTIGRALNLNEDLIEAIGLGHDLGHAPFGHIGESILNEICIKNNIGYFNHNIQSVRLLKSIENNGKGRNLTIQVLDGIMCHNGEKLRQVYEYKNKSKEEFLDEYNKALIDKDFSNEVNPMTLEGCVVRISDVIAYVGRDIEDAISLKLIKRSDIPSDIVDVLGDNNSDIVNNLILDVINNSVNKPYIKLSDHVFEELEKLQAFNYKNIYNRANSKERIDKYRNMFNTLFNIYLEDLNKNNKNSSIYSDFLNNMSNEYINNTKKERIVIDYIAGMTDDYFLNKYEKCQ